MAQLKDILLQHQSFHSVVPFDRSKDKLLLLDFTEKNSELTEEILDDTRKFTDYINLKLQTSNSKYGIGGYAEHRTVYSRSKVFDAKGGSEPRRLHLGIDIWGKPYTKVMAPLNGIVHSFAFNNGFGDYGVTIILTHQLDNISFHTLYGHLSLNSIKNLQEGDVIKRGDVFAEFGIPFENGHWPPHLHFQIIMDMQGMKGDYPGVCALSEKDFYLTNCPDPDLILQMMQYASST
ncbi:MAG: peptidoglycan DD-metalloendopeptidase family protein [Chitinophagaceae bacterium]|nr:peptidoglycan DD-metalloendopeptidase family protein [Chitinophagaceae bacterium]